MMDLTRPLRPARGLRPSSVTWLRQEEGLQSTESAEAAVQSSASKEESSSLQKLRMIQSSFRSTSTPLMMTASTLHSTTPMKLHDSSAMHSEPIE